MYVQHTTAVWKITLWTGLVYLFIYLFIWTYNDIHIYKTVAFQSRC